MSSVIINYGLLEAQIRHSNAAANELRRYANDLLSRVASNISSISGGQNGNTSNADYYVKQKVNSLNNQADNYTNFAKKLTSLKEKSQTVDKSVSRMIDQRKEDFIKKHEFIKVSYWQDFINWLIDAKNKCPLFKMIGDFVGAIFDKVSGILDELKYWYRYCGGKEIFAEIKAYIGVVLAVCAFIATLPASSFLAVCVAIGAAIALVSAIANFATSIIAADRATSGDPCWARFYSKQDTIQDVLRKNNFGNKTLNWLSNITATGIDITETFCNIVNIVGTIKDARNFIKEINRISKLKSTKPLKVLKDYIFNTGKHYRGRNARQISKQGLRSYIQSREKWNKGGYQGLKSFEKYVKKIYDFGSKTVDFVFDRGKVKVEFNKGKISYKDFGIGRVHDSIVNTFKDITNKYHVNVNSYAKPKL